MLERLRTPFFIIALVLIIIVVMIEVGDTAILSSAPVPMDCTKQETEELRDACANTDLSPGLKGSPGKAIPYMALLDGVVLFTTALIGLGVVVRPALLGRVQGCGTCVFSFLTCSGGCAMILGAIVLLFVMIGLLLAFPFGTIAYMIIYGSFDTGSARAVLSILMTLKIAYAILLMLGHERFLQNLGLVLIVLTSLLGNIIITFLHGFPPGFLVSITDVVGAIIVALLAVIWAIVLLIVSIPSIIATLRTSRV
jgi:hypothetical protein